MTYLLRFSYISLFCIALISLSSCGDDEEVTPVVPETTPSAVEFAVGNADFSTLVAALTNADLVSTLEGDGPFTIFAPTNAAFQALLDSNADWNALEDIPTDVLTAVLTNHVVAGEVKSTDLSEGYVETLSATPFGVNTSLYVNLDDGVTLNGNVKVTGADNIVSNGVIHAIDAVILPPNIVTFATANPAFSSLVAALTRADLTTDFVGALSGEGPFTVFAPTNDAFQALLDSNMDWTGLGDIPAEVLESVLLYHVSAAGNVRSTDLSDGQVVPTLSGDNTFSINLTGATPVINATMNTANIIATDVQATNGVIHVIDAVLLPQL